MANEQLFDERFKSRYKILEAIGSGGAGQVFRAHQKDLDRYVAVKFINPRLFKDAESVARFRQEGAIAASLVHENIVQVYDVGESNALPYIVYELVEGHDLAEHIARHGQLDVNEAMDTMVAVSSGLALAHERGIVHRDLKAENILIDKDGTIKLADFGIAKAQESGIKTETGVVLGTPSYMAPEQVRGERVSPASDVYALGVIFFEMIMGRLPFWGKSPMETALKHLHEEPPRVEVAAKGNLGPRLDRMIRERMLAKDQQDRYRDAGDFLKRLTALREGKAAEFEIATKAFKVEDGPKDDKTGAAATPSATATKPIRRGDRTLAQSRAGTKSFESSAVHGAALKVKARDARRARDRLMVIGVVAVVVVVMTVLSWVLLHSHGGPAVDGTVANYDVIDITEAAGFYDATLRWRSSAPYPTVLELWPRDEPTNRRTCQNPARQEKTRQHELTVEELEEATVYDYRIVFPNGNKSFQRTFSTKGFRLLACRAAWLEPGLFHIDVQTVNPHQVKVVASVDKKVVFEQLSRGLDQKHRFEARVDEYHRDYTYDVYFYKEAGDIRPTKFLKGKVLKSYTHNMDIVAGQIADSVAALNVRQRFERLRQTQSRDEMVAVVQDMITKARATVVEPLHRFEEYRDVFFTYPTIDVYERHSMYEAITGIKELNHFAALLGVNERVDFGRVIGGDYIVRDSSRAPMTAQILPIRFESHFKKHDDYIFGLTGQQAREPIGPRVANLNAVEFAELEIQTEGLTAGAALVVTINTRFGYRLLGSAQARRGGSFYQSIDTRVLNEGVNTIAFGRYSFPGYQIPQSLRVVKAVLRLARRR